MTDTRYRERGYSAEFREEAYGAFLDIRRHGKVVCGIGVGFFTGGQDSAASVVVKRFQPDEFRSVDAVDDFDGADE